MTSTKHSKTNLTKRALLIILCSCSLSGLNAQTRQLASFRIALPDSSGRQFFNRNDLHKYIVEFEQEKPVSVTMYKNTGMYGNADSVADEFYDLEFEGDKYLIKKKYEHINIPSLPVLDMSYWAAIGNIQHFKVRYEVPKAVVFKDSAAYLFNVWSYPDDPDFFLFRMGPKVARYKGDIGLLAGRLERAFREKGHLPVTDSIFIFRGIVQRDGSLTDLELIVGENGSFSELIQLGLTESGAAWEPVFMNRTIATYVRIYARLHADKRITLDISGRNRQTK